MFRPQRGPRSSLLIGLLVVAIGVVLLLDQFGIISQWKVFRFWPLLLILVGLRQIIRCSRWNGRMVGIFLIMLGGVFQLENLGYDRVRIETVWPVFIIFGGILLMLRASSPRRSLHSRLEDVADKWKNAQGGTPVMDSRLNQVSIFGGGEYRINSKNFQGGEATAIFGGFEIDLTQADIEGEEAVIDATSIFGGGEIRVPESWLVSVEGVGIFGGFEDKTHHPQPDATGPQKRLIIRGTAIFGGMEIKN
jgi:predicted membrane protein